MRHALLLLLLAAASARAETIELTDGKTIAGATPFAWHPDRLLYTVRGELRQVARHRVKSVRADAPWPDDKVDAALKAAEDARLDGALDGLREARAHASAARRKAVVEALARRLLNAERLAEAWAVIAEFPKTELALEVVIAGADRAKRLVAKAATTAKPSDIRAILAELSGLSTIPGSKVSGALLADGYRKAANAVRPQLSLASCGTCGGASQTTCQRCRGQGYYVKKKAVFGGTTGTRYVDQKVRCKTRVDCKTCRETGLALGSLPRDEQAALKKLGRQITDSMAKKAPSETVGALGLRVFRAGVTFPSDVALPYPQQLMGARQTLRRLPRNAAELPARFTSAWNAVTGSDKTQTVRLRRLLLLRLALEWAQLFDRLARVAPMGKKQMPAQLPRPGTVPLRTLSQLMAEAPDLDGQWVRTVARVDRLGEAAAVAPGRLIGLPLPLRCQTLSVAGVTDLKALFAPLARSSSARSKGIVRWLETYPASQVALRAATLAVGQWVLLEGRLQLPEPVGPPTLELWQVRALPPVATKEPAIEDEPETGGEDGGDTGGSGSEVAPENRPLPPILTPGGSVADRVLQADQYFDAATSESGKRRAHYLEAARRWYLSALTLTPGNAYVQDRIRDCKRLRD